MSTPQSVAHDFVAAVAARPHLQHATVRIGLLLTRIAEVCDSTEFDIFSYNLNTGLDIAGVEIPGVNFRHETIGKSLGILQDEGLIQIDVGTQEKSGRKSKLFTLRMDQ